MRIRVSTIMDAYLLLRIPFLAVMLWVAKNPTHLSAIDKA